MGFETPIEAAELTPQQKYSRNLRALADWYEQHPDAPIDSPYVSRANYSFKASPEEIRAIGAGEKDYAGSLFYYRVKHEFFTIEWIEGREKVCTPRIVGKRTVPSVYYPEHEEDIVEWDCPGSLLAPAEAKEEIIDEIPF
jgi:hypothetical protein